MTTPHLRRLQNPMIRHEIARLRYGPPPHRLILNGPPKRRMPPLWTVLIGIIPQEKTQIPLKIPLPHAPLRINLNITGLAIYPSRIRTEPSIRPIPLAAVRVARPVQIVVDPAGSGFCDEGDVRDFRGGKYLGN